MILKSIVKMRESRTLLSSVSSSNFFRQLLSPSKIAFFVLPSGAYVLLCYRLFFFFFSGDACGWHFFQNDLFLWACVFLT